MEKLKKKAEKGDVLVCVYNYILSLLLLFSISNGLFSRVLESPLTAFEGF